MRKDKIGFATPEFQWLSDMRNELKNYITTSLEEFLNVKEILRDWDMLIDNQPKSGITNIWRFINFAVWKKVYRL